MNALTRLARMSKINSAVTPADITAISNLNIFTAKRGLMLSDNAAREIAHTRLRALHENNRIELGIGTLEKIILIFSSSQHITQQDWEELIHTVVECFYYVKTETHDSVNDNELISFMFDDFEVECEGSIELLEQHIEAHVRRINGGTSEDFDE